MKITVKREYEVPMGKTCKGCCNYIIPGEFSHSHWKCEVFDKSLEQKRNGDLIKCKDCLRITKTKEMIKKC